MKLTKSIIDEMTYGKEGNKADLRYDSVLRGFGVRVFPSGVKSFFVDYRTVNGTKKRYTIGKYGTLTLKQARELAQSTLSEVISGNDPALLRKENREKITFTQLAEKYIQHITHRNKSVKDDKQRLRDHILPSIGTKKLSEIKLTHLQTLSENIKEKLTPATSNRCSALIKRMFATAVEWELVKVSPASNLKIFREPPPRNIVLTPDDMKKLIEACKADQNIFLGSLFLLAMFTGRRIGELQRAKWSDIDITGRIWKVPDTKAGEQQYIVITDDVLEILNRLPQLHGNPYLIVGGKDGSHVVHYRPAWDRIIKVSGLKPFPPHGLRHNYASTLVAMGTSLTHVQQLLGHKSPLTTNKYAHHRNDDLVREASKFPKTTTNLK